MRPNRYILMCGVLAAISATCLLSAQEEHASESEVAAAFKSIAQQQSQGVVTVDSFHKTNGMAGRTPEGFPLYVMQFEADVTFNAVCRWSIMPGLDPALAFSVVRPQPGSTKDSWSNFLYQSTNPGQPVQAGAHFHIVGSIQLLKTENGWQMQQMTESAINPTQGYLGPTNESNNPSSLDTNSNQSAIVDASPIPLAEESDPGYTDVYFLSKGNEFLQQRNYPIALRCFNVALSREAFRGKPDRLNEYLDRGIARLAARNFPAAIDDFSTVVSQWPTTNSGAALYRAVAYQCNHDAAAAAEYTNYLSTHQDSVIAIGIVALQAQQKGDSDQPGSPLTRLLAAKDPFAKLVGSFLCRKCAINDFLAASADIGNHDNAQMAALRKCFTYYLAGMQAAIDKDTKNAGILLGRAVKEGTPLSPVFALAEVALLDLGQQ